MKIIAELAKITVLSSSSAIISDNLIYQLKGQEALLDISSNERTQRTNGHVHCVLLSDRWSLTLRTPQQRKVSR